MLERERHENLRRFVFALLEISAYVATLIEAVFYLYTEWLGCDFISWTVANYFPWP